MWFARRRKPRKCPSCGHKPFGSILWGMPGMGEKMRADVEAGRVVIGGCLIGPDDPDWQCAKCGTAMWSDGRVSRPGRR